MPTDYREIGTNLLDALGTVAQLVADIWRQASADAEGARVRSAALVQSLHAHVGERAGATARARAAIDAERAELFPLVAPREPEKP